MHHQTTDFQQTHVMSPKDFKQRKDLKKPHQTSEKYSSYIFPPITKKYYVRQKMKEEVQGIPHCLNYKMGKSHSE